MKNVIVFPGKYIQGRGVIAELPSYIQQYGGRGLIISTRSMLQVMQGIAAQCNSVVEQLQGDCCRQEIDRLKAVGQKVGATIVIGVGGGRPMDTARVVADELELPCVTCPTVASSDAACAFLSIVNGPKDNPGVEEFHFCRQNPNLVLADEELIMQAPARYLTMGMADALSTWFEAESCEKSGALSYTGGGRTLTAMAVARLCYDTILRYGRDAYKAAKEKKFTPAFSKVVEANILTSGCGFGGCGLATAHGVATAFEIVPNDDHTEVQHGEVVAFGILVGLMINRKPAAEIEEIYSLFYDLDLPITFAQLGYQNMQGEKLDHMARVASRSGNASFPKESFVYNEPVEVNFSIVRAAMTEADAYGRAYQERMEKIGAK